VRRLKMTNIGGRAVEDVRLLSGMRDNAVTSVERA
jgi:hypothetical protein